MFEVRRATLEDVDSIVKITQEAFEKYIKLAGIQDTPALHETREQVIKDIDTKIVMWPILTTRWWGACGLS